MSMRRNHDGTYGKCGPGDGTGMKPVPKREAHEVLEDADTEPTTGQGYPAVHDTPHRPK